MALVWEVNMTGGSATIGGNGYHNASGSASSTSGSLDDSTADMYSGAACWAIENRFSASGDPGFALEFAGNVTGGWDYVEITNQFAIPYSSFTRTYYSAASPQYTRFTYETTDAIADGYSDGYPRIIFETNKTYNFKFHTGSIPSNYGARVYGPTGTILFTHTRPYIKIGATGSVTLGAGATSSTIVQEDATSTDVYIYVTAPSTNSNTPFTVTRSSTGFTIKNNTASTQTFGYAVMRYA